MKLQFLLFSFIFVLFSNATADNTTLVEDGRAFTTDCTRYFFYTDMAALPYTVTLIKPDTGVHRGLGLVVNVYWFLTNQQVRDRIEAIYDQIQVYQNVYDPDLIMSYTRYVHITFMTSLSGNASPSILSQYVLMKVCPIFRTPSSFVEIPPNQTPLAYTVGARVYIFVANSGGGPIEYFCMKIVANSNCAALSSEFNPAEHFCIKDVNDDVSVNPREISYAGFVLINNDFRGFILATNGLNTAIVQKIEAHADWIRDNSPPIPYY